MVKKKSKRSSTSLNHTSALNESSLSDCSQDISTASSHPVSGYFKVLLSLITEDKDEYKKWTKNCYWKNIAFIAPSVLRDYGCTSLVHIQGKTNCAVFMVKPLKSVKNRNVVLLNGMGFNNDELVTLSPVSEVREAKEIFIATESSLPQTILQDMLVKKLSNTFIWTGFSLQFSIYDVEHKCTVSKVIPDEDTSKSNCFADIDSSKCISSLFSSLSLKDSGDTQRMDCFITNHRSSIIVNDSSGQIPDLPFPLFKHIGGCHKQIETIKNYLDTFFKTTKDEVRRCPSVLLLSGPPKTSKSTVLNAIFNETGLPVRKINLILLMLQKPSAASEEIKLAIKSAIKSSPSFLLLDKFELFCRLGMKDHISNLFRHLNEIGDNQVLVVATLWSEFSFERELLHSLSVQEVKFTLPNTLDREEIIEKILINLKQELSSHQISYCAQSLFGLGGGDIFKIFKFDVSLLSKIRMKNTSATTPESTLNFCDVETAIKKKKLLSSDLKANKMKWSDIGGMDNIKKELLDELELLMSTPKEKLKRFNYSPLQGILLYGPPGCSKTMIAKALATECNWNFISKKASDIMNMYVGESEKAVTNLFLEARYKAPCIIFLDEIDAIAPARNSSSSASGVQNRVVNCLLSEMAGIEALKDILIIAATNRPDIIDDALLRRGRIGKHIYVPLPDFKTRKELFRLSMKKRQVSEDVDFDDLAERTEGYTGAEIVQLCNEAAMQLLIEDPDCLSPIFKRDHFNCALLAVQPLTHKDTIQFYEQFALKNS